MMSSESGPLSRYLSSFLSSLTKIKEYSLEDLTEEQIDSIIEEIRNLEILLSISTNKGTVPLTQIGKQDFCVVLLLVIRF